MEDRRLYILPLLICITLVHLRRKELCGRRCRRGEGRKIQRPGVWLRIFNSIRRLGERRNVEIDVDHRREMRRFNEFIENNELVDIPMVGRKYVWYKPNGLIKSRIHRIRILVSTEWLDKWSDSIYYVLDRSMYDHCALVLKMNIMDCGPKSFRSLDIW